MKTKTQVKAGVRKSNGGNTSGVFFLFFTF